MKKLSLVVAIASIALAPIAFAEQAAPVNGYYTTQSASLSAKALNFPATEIFVSNAGPNLIHTVIPNALNVNTNPLTVTPIQHNTYAGKTHVVLTDQFNNAFYDALVCHYAFINVKVFQGGYSAYTYNLDQYC